MIRLSLGLVFFPIKKYWCRWTLNSVLQRTDLPQELRDSGTSQPCAARCQACPSLVWVCTSPLSLSPSKFDSVHALSLMCTSTGTFFLFQATQHVYADNFLSVQLPRSVKMYQPLTISCHFVAQGNYSGALSHTHTLTISPCKKIDVRMHNPEKHSHAHCLSFEKKNPHWTMMNTVDTSGKKKIEK